jgi:rubredoxin
MELQAYSIAWTGSKKILKPMKYVCPCGYEYDPAIGDPVGGIAPGTAFEDLPETWNCPVCGLDKDAFDKVD